MKRAVPIAAAILSLSIVGCGGPDEEGYTDTVVYYGEYAGGDADQWLEWGYDACKALDEGTERRFALEETNRYRVDAQATAKEIQISAWRLDQATKYLCPEQEGETIDWYTTSYVDASGRANKPIPEETPLDDWVANGAKVVDDQTLTVTYPMLIDDERAWFKRHKTLPTFPANADVSSDVGDWEDKVEDIRRMTDLRITNAPKGVVTFRPRQLDPWDAVEDFRSFIRDHTPEHDRFNGYYKLVLDRTIPANGEPITHTQGVMLVAHWEWVDKDLDGDGIPNSQDTDNDIYVGGGDDDDDFNVPGWLCPTRWC